jgi:hypothetical protein
MNTRLIYLLSGLLLVSACESLDMKGDTSSFPIPQEDQIQRRVGKIGGEESLISFGGAEKKEDGSNNPLGVNSFLWRATLDTVSFMPLASADPFGGVIITDWYEDPEAPGERFKINAMILDRALRADSIRVTLFKQRKTPQNTWQDVNVPESTSRKLEDAVLTRARQLRVSQMGY